MWEFGVLAGLLIGLGVVIRPSIPGALSLGGWLTAVVLLVFAFLGRRAALATR
jgi:hypothetical protein